MDSATSVLSDKQIPECVDALGEDLFNVPFDMLFIAESDYDGSDYKWYNPRRYGSNSDSELGSGFSPEEMDELYRDIKHEGLIFPLVGLWQFNDDGRASVKILDGERRWRSLEKMHRQNDKVWSRGEKRFMPACQVHGKIQCRVVAGDDKEALRLAFMLTNRNVSWGEGATACLIKKLRKTCSEEEILNITKKSGQWLREMDKICALDDMTFTYLTDGKINRALALKLTTVDNVGKRHKWLDAAYADAVANHEQEVQETDAALEKAVAREELAEVLLDDAREVGNEEEINKADQDFQEAKEKTAGRKRQRADAAKPKAKIKNLRTAVTQGNDGEEGNGDGLLDPLRPGKIKKQLESLDKLIADDGVGEDGREILPTDTIRVVAACYRKCLIEGEEDIVKVLKRQRDVMAIQSRRAKI